jgi:DNA-binding NarL/FixJ family response regulator
MVETIEENAWPEAHAMTTGMTGPIIRVLTADDHPVFREGIAALMRAETDMAVVGEAVDGVDAIGAYRRLHPDITLMDLRMPRMDGLEAIRAIRSEFPHARIVVLTTYAGDVQVVEALKAGALGYLLKSSLRNELLDTIRAAHQGLRRVSPELAGEIAAHAGEEALSDRDAMILVLAAAGKSNKEIAGELALSENTIKSDMKNIFAKLNVRDRTQAVTVAARRGIIMIQG